MANAVGPQEISKLSHSEKFNKEKLGSFVCAPDHYFSTLDITQRRRSNIQAVYFIGWFPSTNTGFSFLFVRPQCVFPPRKCYMFPDANSYMWVGRILISQTETERPTPAVVQASSSLPDC